MSLGPLSERRDIGDELPNLLITEHRPPRHRCPRYTVANNQKSPAGRCRFRPRRYCKICRRRVQSFPALAVTVRAGAVANDAVGCKNRGARLLGRG
jgi:hypothetical protein